MRIAHAGAFTLRPFERDGEIDFDPVLFAAKPAGGTDDLDRTDSVDGEEDARPDPEPLLPEHLQKAFTDARFRQFSDARGRYALPDGWLLILSPPLRKAMGVARQVQRVGGEVARDFVRNPRGYLREALGAELDEHLVEKLFKETREFSERVHAIGLWQKKVLPWVQVPREPWLPPEAVGLIVDGAPVQLPAERVAELADRIRDAIEEGRPEVVFDGVPIPATEQTLASLGEIERALAGGEAKPGIDDDAAADAKTDEVASGGRESTGGAEPHVLLVRNNFEEVVFNSDPAPRMPPIDAGLHQAMLRSAPKPHQREGVDWLPPKTEHVRKVAMPDVQANAYSAVVAEARRGKDRGKMLEALQAMRAVSLAPLERSMVASDEDYVRSSARLMAMVSILDEIRDRGEKALLFVEMRAAQADLAGVLQRRYGLARAPMIISGEVAGPRRQERVDAFQAGPPGFDLMILSPKAGGVGLTLTAANNVVHLTRWWNPAVEDQSTDRCYRIGQQRPVNVYLPMALLPGGEEHSFDSRLHALLAQKRALSRDLLMPPALSDEDARRLYEETIA